MPASVPLRRDFDARHLRKLANRCKDARQSRRLLSLAAVYDGMSRGEAARIGGMDRQTLRDCHQPRLTEKGRKIRDAVGELFNRHADGLISRNVLSAEAVEDINSSLKRVERYWSDQIRYIY